VRTKLESLYYTDREVLRVLVRLPVAERTIKLSTLAEKAQIGERTVDRCVTRLENCGLVKVQRPKRPGPGAYLTFVIHPDVEWQVKAS
jgi:predicted transcriptional regulator